jgi:mono/diheme cytochrome c family protein
MNSAKLVVSIAFIAAFLVACATDTNVGGASSPSAGSSPIASATATPDEFAAVRTIFKAQCSECHGETGGGGQVKIDGKKLRVPSLKAGHALKH